MRIVARPAASTASPSLSSPGDRWYSRLSVNTHLFSVVEPLFRVPPGAFTPPPRVDSRIVRVRRRPMNVSPLVATVGGGARAFLHAHPNR